MLGLVPFLRYVPSKGRSTSAMRLFACSGTKPSTTQKAESIRSQGVLSPLLVRPLTDQSFEIIAGARRYRAAQMAEVPTVPVRVVNLTDAEALEVQLIDLSIVGKSFLCLYATWARRLYVIDVPSLPQIAGYNGMPPPRAMECGR